MHHQSATALSSSRTYRPTNHPNSADPNQNWTDWRRSRNRQYVACLNWTRLCRRKNCLCAAWMTRSRLSQPPYPQN